MSEETRTEETALELETIEFAENPEPRCPCVLILDTSGSMQGAGIQALNEGLKTFERELKADPIARKRVEVAIVTFGHDVEVVQDFVTADQFSAPVLSAPGRTTNMGTGIVKAIEIADGRKASYKTNGITYFQPWALLITDGEASDSLTEAGQKVQTLEAAEKLLFIAIGVKGANMAQLATVTAPTRPPLPLEGLNFSQFFIWLGQSISAKSKSKQGEKIALPSPGWMAAV